MRMYMDLKSQLIQSKASTFRIDDNTWNTLASIVWVELQKALANLGWEGQPKWWPLEHELGLSHGDLKEH